MRYIEIIPGSQPSLCICEGEIPKLKEGYVLIKVAASGVNHLDLLQKRGKYPLPPHSNPILGVEVAGEIVKIGKKVTAWNVGDLVCSLVEGGGYAEYCLAPQELCLPIPAGMSVEEAASLPEVYFTVWSNLFMRTQLHSGETVLIHGGSSGIGSCAIQLAKAFQAFVITTVGTEEKISFCKQLKADIVINYKKEDFFSLLKEKGVDVVLDIVGGEYFEKNLLLLKEEGRLVQIANRSKEKVVFDLSRLLYKRLTVVGSTLRAQPLEKKALIAKQLMQHVWPLFTKKALKAVVGASFFFAEAEKAHQLMGASSHCGKIILIP